MHTRTAVLPLTALCVAYVGAQAPQWIGPTALAPADAPVLFEGCLTLPQTPDRALLRVTAYDRYRLSVGGQAVSVGDTPWDGETYDVTPLLQGGPNTIEVAVAADAETPRNCWLWMRRDLPVPGGYAQLSFRTRGARANEWLYIEVIDADGNSSGLYCPERGHGDFQLGADGAEVEHIIDLTQDARLDYRGGSGACDFARIASVGVRVDQKEALASPAGAVAFSGLALEGAERLDLSDAGDWRIEAGTGEYRRSGIAAEGQGTLILRYDFTPVADPSLAVDLRAWRAGVEIARLTSGPQWQAAGKPARVRPSPADFVSWTPIEIGDLEAAVTAPCRARTALDFGGRDRCAAGESLAGNLRVWALDPMPEATAEVWAEDWSGAEVFRTTLAVAWDGADGRARFATPVLPPGLYRFTAAIEGESETERHAALAVLPPGETRVSSVFAGLTPLARDPALRGIDISWADSPALLLGIRDQGASLLQVHLASAQLDNGELAELLAFCQATGLRFALNNEEANWVASSLAPDGRERFDAPNGCHRWDLEEATLDAAVATGLFEGVVYDEGEHMQLCRNFYANLADSERRKPYLVETTGMSLPQARDAFEGAARDLAGYHAAHGARMIVESVFPVLWHPLADAGVTLCPKLLKEDIHPVVLASALGAAKQYGAELWLTPDLWYLDEFPGHDVAEYAAALRVAHLAGVDNVYTEGFGPLCRVRGASYELTDYGSALRSFIHDYVPSHPRDYTYRDYEPEVAIIRFPDGDWGQGSCGYWDTLYGALDLPPTRETSEWLEVWHLLTGGATDARAVNANNTEAYPRGAWRFCYPSAPVAVYDDRVGDGPLATVDTLFVCGTQVSEGSLASVARRVRDGACCIIAERLCPPEVRARAAALPARIAEGAGEWIVVGGFHPEDLGEFASRIPPAGETMRLRFRGHEIGIGPAGEVE